MIDSRTPDSGSGRGWSQPPGYGYEPSGPPAGSRPPVPPRPTTELFSDLFSQPPESKPAAGRPVAAETPSAGASDRKSAAPPRRPARTAGQTPIPRAPLSLRESGLTLMQVCDQILKQLYLQGSLYGIDMSRNARLPYQVVDEGLQFLKDEKCIEVASGEMIGRASYRFNLTELGRVRAREAFEQCRYVGPAPVALDDYIEQCRRQSVAGTTCSPEALREAFNELIIRPNLLAELGPAVCSGKSIFIYGPPGNGKTMVAKGLGRFLNNYGGEIYIPYAIHTEGHIITLFDPTLHQTTDDAELSARGRLDDLSTYRGEQSGLAGGGELSDLRWRRIRRPVIITGGELTLEMLDLRYNKTSNFYTAPLHIKANGGVFLIDDFGRQIVSPRDLLNRWILPLEERIDFLTLATGKKFSIPFEQLIIFSTNLDPRELVDEAFLRRIRHKIKIGPPPRELFTDIFRLCCQQRNIPFDPNCVDYLYSNFYDRGKPPRSSDPRDLLEIVQSICRFRNQRVLLTEELMAEATERFFCQL